MANTPDITSQIVTNTMSAGRMNMVTLICVSVGVAI
jgi:hypothetical protein